MMRFTHFISSAALVTGLASPVLAQSVEVAPPAGSAGGFAVVTLAGRLVHSSNVKNFTHTGAGTYVVKFNNDVSQCSATATIARRGKGSVLPGYIVVSNSGQNRVNVYTFLTTTLLAADYPFDLTVTC